MTTRNRIALLVLWVLSMVGAAQWGASASPRLPGSEARFVLTGSRDGTPTGHFTARVGNRWVLVQVDPPSSPLPPLLANERR